MHSFIRVLQIIISNVVYLYQFVLLAYAISTWIPANSEFTYKLKVWLRELVEPTVGLVQKYLPGTMKMFAVIITYFLVRFIGYFLIILLNIIATSI